MKANATSLLALFERGLQLEVPLFQRQYVWNVADHWTPLWEDISRKFSEYLEGRQDSPVHFLGAMVLDQKQVPVTHIPKPEVDGDDLEGVLEGEEAVTESVGEGRGPDQAGPLEAASKKNSLPSPTRAPNFGGSSSPSATIRFTTSRASSTRST